MPLKNTAYSVLRKDVNYVVACVVLPIKNCLSCVKKATVSLPKKVTKVVQQETVRIMKASRNPTVNLSGAERRAVWATWTNADIKVLPASKGNAAVVHNASDYNQKTAAL